MNATKKTETIILNFEKQAFEYATEMYNEKIALIDNIKAVAKKELDLNIDVSDSESLKQNIFKAVEKKYKEQNTLNLSGEKLVELMQIDLKPINDASRLLKAYDLIDANVKPTKEMFTTYVNNDKEKERYNHAKNLIDMIIQSRLYTNDNRAMNNYLIVFGSVLSINAEQNELKPLISFVKGN